VAQLLFRPHRGGFDESMALVEEVPTLCELTNIAGKIVNGLVSGGMIRCSHYCFDERNKWNTYIITVDGVGVIGFTNGPIKQL
jgi:hypothetical protein